MTETLSKVMQPLERLAATLSARLPSYTHARARVAIAKADGVDRLIRGCLTFERGEPAADEMRDYGTVRFESKMLDLSTAKQLIIDLGTNGRSDIMALRVTRDKRSESHGTDDEVPVALGPVGEHYQGLPSPRTARRAHEWPSEVFSLGPKSRNQQNHQLRHTPIVTPGLPIVPDVWEAVTAWTGIEQQGTYESQNSLVVILPDFRARIDKIKIGPNGATIRIETGDLDPESVEVRASTHQDKPARDIPIRQEGVEAHIDSLNVPDSLFIFVTDRKIGDVIDWAIIAKWYGNDGHGVEYIAPAKQLAQRITDGENETVEFKGKLVGDRKGQEHFLFIQSVVAFANMNGGMILVGVQDDSAILGVESPEPDIQRIHEWVEAHCEPPIVVETQKVEIDGKPIIVVHVAEGTNKPYQHKSNHAFYVRHGSTDRPARRTELDEIYKKRASGEPAFVLGGRNRWL